MTPSNFKKFNVRCGYRIGLAAVLALIILGLFLALRQVYLRAVISDGAAAFYADPAYPGDLLLKDFPVYEQSYANSCGPTTISMIYSYLVEPVSEQELAAWLGFPLGQSGMLPGQFFERLQAVLGENGYRVEHLVNRTDVDFLEHAYLQLKEGIPVPIYFSTLNAWDMPNYDTHYSAIIGMRPQKGEVVIANAYGFLEEMAISELLDAMKYENFGDAPLDFRLGVFSGVINMNNLFSIRK